MARNSSDTQRSRRASREFDFLSFVWRFLASLLLVMVTYNPSEHSYVHWLRAATPENPLGPEHFVVGIALLIGWVILLAATHRSLGTFGLLLGAEASASDDAEVYRGAGDYQLSQLPDCGVAASKVFFSRSS